MPRLNPYPVTAEALEVVRVLIENEPGEDISKTIKSLDTCPGCKSTNTTPSDEKGLCDCLDCGIWFNPRRTGTVKESEESGEDASGMVDDFLSDLGAKDVPRITTSYTRVEQVGDDEYDEERGWEDEEGHEFNTSDYDTEEEFIAAVVDWLSDKGAYGTSSSSWQHGLWYTYLEEEVDGSVEYSFHLNGFTPEQEKQVYIQFMRVVHRRSVNENDEDSLSDIEGFLTDLAVKPEPRVATSYSRITLTGDDGDYDEEHGWEDEDGHVFDPLDYAGEDNPEQALAKDVARWLRYQGAYETSCGNHFHKGMWYIYSSESLDGRGSTEYHFHLKDFTEEQEKMVFDAFMHSRNRMR